jgi:hypothetical protein
MGPVNSNSRDTPRGGSRLGFAAELPQCGDSDYRAVMARAARATLSHFPLTIGAAPSGRAGS